MEDWRWLGMAPMLIYLVALVVRWRPAARPGPDCPSCGSRDLTSDTAGAACRTCGTRWYP
jgi:hypothetical protein